MPKIDSTFDYLIYAASKDVPFAGDRPILPEKVITDGMQALEDVARGDLVDLLQAEGQELLQRSLPLVEARNENAIANLTWRLSITAQRPIYQAWESGYNLGAGHGHREMLVSLPNDYHAIARGETYDVTAALKKAIEALITLSPPEFLNSGARQAVLNRVIYLAGSFSNRMISQFRQALIAAIVPQPNTGYPITRPQLLARLQQVLQVGALRAEAIARTEITHAYNAGRLASFQQSSLVQYVRFLAITDARTSDICLSRNGMIIPVSNRAAIAANQPPCHVNCFPPGTLVQMSDGSSMPIESVKVGQRVKTATASNVQRVYNVIKSRFTGFLYKITLEDGTEISTTPDHPVWNGADFIPASTVAPGVSLYSANASAGPSGIQDRMGDRQSSSHRILVSRNGDASRNPSRTHGIEQFQPEQDPGDPGHPQERRAKGCSSSMARVSGGDAANLRFLCQPEDGRRPNREKARDTKVSGPSLAAVLIRSAAGPIRGCGLSMVARNWRSHTEAFPGKTGQAITQEGIQRPVSIRSHDGKQSIQTARGHQENACHQKVQGILLPWRTKSGLWQELQARGKGAHLQAGVSRGPRRHSLPFGLGGESCQDFESLGATLAVRATGISSAWRMDVQARLLLAETGFMGRGEGQMDRGCSQEVRAVQRDLSRSQGRTDRGEEVQSPETNFQGLTPLRVVAIARVPYDGWVYNLSVEEDEVYIANGVLVHNCRSTISPLMPKVNKKHQAIVDDPDRLWSKRSLVPLPKGWNR